MLGKLEKQYKELKDEGHCTMNEDQLLTLYMEVEVLEEDEYNAMISAYKHATMWRADADY